MSDISDSSRNPLLAPSPHPHGAPPFDIIKPGHFLPAVQAAIIEAEAEIKAIRDNPAPPDFENTVSALALAGRTLSRILSIFENVAAANGNDVLRDLEPEIDAARIRYDQGWLTDPVLFDRVRQLYAVKDTLPLSPEEKTLLQEMYRDFVRAGAQLGPDEQFELQGILESLADLEAQFNTNLVKSMADYARIVEDEALLSGLPSRMKDYYKALAEAAGHNGKWMIVLNPPPTEVFTHADNRDLRREVFEAQEKLAMSSPYDNRDVVLSLVQLRHRQAQLLGYGSYADFMMEERMAGTTKTVMSFLEDGARMYRPAAEDYIKKLGTLAQADGLAKIEPWDVAYYGRKLQEETASIDPEELRPYFELENVIHGLHRHAENLFGIKIVECKDAYPVYHPDVRVFEVRDGASGEVIGLLYADYYARPGAKGEGAWMNTFRNRGFESGEDRCAIVTNVCNFQPPAGGQPTLLSPEDVEMVFHEFGHGLHALLAKGKYPGLTGVNVKLDFVELPSQLQENWAGEYSVLATFAKHHLTGEVIPKELVDKMNLMSELGAGFIGLQQAFLGLLDMKWHMTDPAKIKSVESFEEKACRDYWVFQGGAGLISTRFDHLFTSGYAVGFYSYKWAEVMEADIFEMFAEKGIYDKALAKKLKETLYSKGGTEDPMKIFIELMGREPDPAALYRREGITPPEKKTSGPPVPDLPRP